MSAFGTASSPTKKKPAKKLTKKELEAQLQAEEDAKLLEEARQQEVRKQKEELERQEEERQRIANRPKFLDRTQYGDNSSLLASYFPKLLFTSEEKTADEIDVDASYLNIKKSYEEKIELVENVAKENWEISRTTNTQQLNRGSLDKSIENSVHHKKPEIGELALYKNNFVVIDDLLERNAKRNNEINRSRQAYPAIKGSSTRPKLFPKKHPDTTTVTAPSTSLSSATTLILPKSKTNNNSSFELETNVDLITFHDYLPFQTYRYKIALKNVGIVSHHFRVFIKNCASSDLDSIDHTSSMMDKNGLNNLTLESKCFSLETKDFVSTNIAVSSISLPSLSPGLKTCIMVSFTPREYKNYYGSLVIETSSGSKILPMEALVGKSQISLPPSVDFDFIPLTANALTTTLAVRNNGKFPTRYTSKINELKNSFQHIEYEGDFTSNLMPTNGTLLQKSEEKLRSTFHFACNPESFFLMPGEETQLAISFEIDDNNAVTPSTSGNTFFTKFMSELKFVTQIEFNNRCMESTPSNPTFSDPLSESTSSLPYDNEDDLVIPSADHVHQLCISRLSKHSIELYEIDGTPVKHTDNNVEPNVTYFSSSIFTPSTRRIAIYNPLPIEISYRWDFSHTTDSSQSLAFEETQNAFDVSPSSGTLLPYERQSFEIRFLPVMLASCSGKLSLYDSSSDAEQFGPLLDLAVLGEVLPRDLQANVKLISFGNLIPCTTTERTFSIDIPIPDTDYFAHQPLQLLSISNRFPDRNDEIFSTLPNLLSTNQYSSQIRSLPSTCNTPTPTNRFRTEQFSISFTSFKNEVYNFPIWLHFKFSKPLLLLIHANVQESEEFDAVQ